jgi:hypothetical protein
MHSFRISKNFKKFELGASILFFYPQWSFLTCLSLILASSFISVPYNCSFEYFEGFWILLLIKININNT